MPEIKLDGHRPRGLLAERLLEPGQTLRRLIDAVRSELLHSCRYLAHISVNGQTLTREHLSARLSEKVEKLEKIELTSRPLAEVLLPPFEHAVNQIQLGIEDLKTTLSLLSDGQEAKACEHLASQIGVWPLMAEQYERLLSALQAVGWPTDDLRGLNEIPAQFTLHVGELRELLLGRDFPAVVMLLSGPVAGVHKKTLRSLGYLKNRIQKPRRRRKTKSAS